MMEGSDNAPLFSQCCSPRKPGDKFFPCVHGFNGPRTGMLSNVWPKILGSAPVNGRDRQRSARL